MGCMPLSVHKGITCNVVVELASQFQTGRDACKHPRKVSTVISHDALIVCTVRYKCEGLASTLPVYFSFTAPSFNGPMDASTRVTQVHPSSLGTSASRWSIQNVAKLHR